MDTISASVIAIVQIHLPQNWSSPKHHHPDFEEILVVTKGSLEVIADNELYRVHVGQIVGYPRGFVHYERTIDGAPLHLISINARYTPIPVFSVAPVISTDRNNRIQTAAQWAMDVLHNSEYPNNELVVRGLLTAIISECLSPDEQYTDDRINHIIEYIENYYTHSITLDELAKEACMSKHHFVHVFKRMTGMSPMHYVRKIRVDAVWKLLVSSSLSHTQIASKVGFSSELQMYRTFRGITGCTPRDVRYR